MKKYDLLKVLGITFLIVALISWVVPAGYYSNGTYTSLEQVVPIGLYDLFRLPVISIVTFIQYGLLFLAIGGFYGVINKTGVYSKFIDSIVSKFKNKSLFLTITIILFAILTSVIGSPNMIFILIPLFMAVLIRMGYSKITAFASTVGAMLVGQVGTTFAFSTWGYFKYIFNISMTDLILVRSILLVMITALYVIIIRKKSSKEISSKNKNEDKVDIPLHEERKGKKGVLPLVIMLVLTFAVLAVGTYNWYYSFEVEFFNSIYETVMTFEFLDMPIFKNILGSVSEFGFFNNYDIMVILLISAFIIGWIYSLKLSEMVDGFIKGLKEMVKPSIYAMLSCVVFTAMLNMLNTVGGDFINTMIGKIVSPEEFSLTATVASGLISSFAYNDFYTLASNISSAFITFDVALFPVIAFVFTTMYSIVMLIAPTSIFLLAGLSYLEIPYKEWIKYIYKTILIIFAIVIVIAVIITML